MITNLSSPQVDLSERLTEFYSKGFFVIEGVFTDKFLESVREAMYNVQKRIQNDMGIERLQRAGEQGVLRLMMAYDPLFYKMLESPAILSVIDATVGNTAIMHLQNGFILPSFPKDDTPTVFQNTFHRDFPRYLNGYLASVNTLVAVDEFKEDNGATFVLPGSHQQDEPPTSSEINNNVIPAVCPAGSVLVFDSTLWHAAGKNTSGKDRLAINHQFTRSFLKQQIDYVRALGDEVIQSLPSRTQQLLGYYTRVVTCLDEYYQPAEMRLYRSGQG